MEKTEIKRKIINIPLQEVGIVRYPYDMCEETEIVKNLEYTTEDEPDIQISYDKFILHRPELKRIFKFCQEQVDSYVKEVLRSPAKLKINTSWIVRSKTGGIIDPHVHNSIICGCLYFEVPDDTTPLILNVQNCLDETQAFDMPIQKGDLVIWDNKLSHWVPQNNNSTTRCSLAFNTSLKEQFDFSLALSEAYKYPNSNIRRVDNTNEKNRRK
tara:strand:+ start:472 stop:1110 length:639 start_codon:yes stop_codon:yes gene_type:complete